MGATIYIIMLIFLTLGIIANLVAKKILIVRKERQLQSPLINDKTRLEKLKQVLPEENEEDIEEIMCCFSSTPMPTGRFRMTYAPFTEHKDIPFNSKFLNISPNGYRLKSRIDNKDPKDTTKTHIFLFGGSTTFGSKVNDSDTIAAYLGKILNKNGDHYRVFNCGRQSYFSTMELIAFQRFLQEGAHIDIAVFIDGLNDVFHNCPVFRNKSRYSEHMGKFWDYIDYLYGYADESFPRLDSAHLLKRLIAQMPLMRLLQQVKKKIVRELMQEEEAVDMQFHEPWARGINPDDIDVLGLSQKISQLTLTNWNIARGLSRQFGIQAFFVYNQSIT